MIKYDCPAGGRLYAPDQPSHRNEEFLDSTFGGKRYTNGYVVLCFGNVIINRNLPLSIPVSPTRATLLAQDFFSTVKFQ